MWGFLRPADSLTDADVHRGLRSLLYDGVCSQVLTALTTGAFLVAFALALGASNKVIGLLAAVGPLAQTVQIPAIALIERVRARKAVAVVSLILARLTWLPIAALPLLVAPASGLAFLVVALLVFFSLGALASCAFNSWVRDLVPEAQMGGYFARRTGLAVLVGAVVSLLAGVGVDGWRVAFGEGRAILAYSILFTVAAMVGLLGTYFLGRTPEPRMPHSERSGLLRALAAPLRDRPFRSVLYFLGAWNFALSFVAPFFTVYLLLRLGLAMRWVLLLAVLSQLVHVGFLRVWSRLADRFTNKSVLTASGPMFLFSVLAWPFLTMPEKHLLTWPLLVLIHMLGGMASAGVNLCAGNLALKAAPKGRATAYLATNALVSGLAATVAPILGGLAADLFAQRELSLTLRWGHLVRPASDIVLPAFHLRGLDFLFVIGFLLGLYALHRLLAVREVGEVDEKIVLASFYQEARLSTLGGAKAAAFFPYTLLRGAVSAVSRATARPPGRIPE